MKKNIFIYSFSLIMFFCFFATVSFCAETDGTTLSDVVYNNFIDGKIQLTNEPYGLVNGSISFFDTEGNILSDVDGFVSYPVFKTGDVFLIGAPFGHIIYDDVYYIICTNEEGLFFYNLSYPLSSRYFVFLSNFCFNFSDGFYSYDYTINEVDSNNLDNHETYDYSVTSDLFHSLTSGNQFIPSETVEFLGFVNFNRYYQYYTSSDLSRHFNELNDLLKNDDFLIEKSPIIAKITSFGDYPNFPRTEIEKKLENMYFPNGKAYPLRRYLSFDSRKNAQYYTYVTTDKTQKGYDAMTLQTLLSTSFAASESYWNDTKIQFSIYIPDNYDDVSVEIALYEYEYKKAKAPGDWWASTFSIYTNVEPVIFTSPKLQNLKGGKTYTFNVDLNAFFDFYIYEFFTVEIYGNGELLTAGSCPSRVHTFLNMAKDPDLKDLTKYKEEEGNTIDNQVGIIDGKVPDIVDGDYDSVIDNSVDTGFKIPTDVDYTENVSNVSNFFTSVWGLLPPTMWTIILTGLTLIVILRVLGR